MKIGFAERDITPVKGTERPGGYGKAFHDGKVHDPCKVRAAVLDDGREQVALVGVDALMVPRSVVLAARAAIQAACGIAPEAVLIGASHSHSAGPVGMVEPGQFDHASPFVQRLAYELSSCADARYTQHVLAQIIAAVQEAHDKRGEARCGVGSGIEDQAAFNRRFRMKNGLTYTHPGKGNPDIVAPAGPIDPHVGVLGAWRDGQFLGCVVNYACHATTGPGGTSADWIYYLEQTIRGVMGQDAVVVFLNGACGDVTQVNNLSPYAIDFGERAARYVGGRVGAEAVKVLLSMEAGELTPLAARSQVLKIPRRRPSAERLRRDMEIASRDPQEVGHTAWTFAKETVLLDALIAKEPMVDVEVQAVQVGPAVFLANPSEFFCQLGLELRARSQFPLTFPVTLANGCVGYVPTEEAFSAHGGGYETRLTSYSNLVVNAGTRIVEALLKLTAELTPGQVPTPPLAPPFKAPWSYGNVPPEP
ncbi:MAG: hypothetical protein NZT92_04100 [Abditibacteriales bacterium]|nr:hypothetical protein [Abditibacteriales bacterium]MDW8365115.1 hypothetical protein [Abditibacteriales bacterium]